MKKILCISAFAFLLAACKKEQSAFDASGTFEAKETIVSTTASGRIMQFTIEEGQQLKANDNVGYIDTVQLYLKKQQLQAQIKAVLSKQPDKSSQLATVQEQIKTAKTEKQRIQNLLNAGAATQKQLDDINAQITVLEKQLAAQQSSLNTTSSSINSEVAPILLQIEQINDQLLKSSIVNPVNGTVLTKYAEQDEIAVAGKALYKIADLSEMTLRAYITGDQLASIQNGQTVNVSVDDGNGGYKQLAGTVTWISDKAEFTPKTIQTKEERANLVYAVKIAVKNDGYIKIGMYGEVNFNI